MSATEKRPKRATYTIQEAAALLGISERSAYRRAKAQRERCPGATVIELAPGVPAIRVGHRWVVPRARLHAVLGTPVPERSE